MALIGLATVTLVGMILWVRSERPLNKAGVGVLYAILTLHSFGVFV